MLLLRMVIKIVIIFPLLILLIEAMKFLLVSYLFVDLPDQIYLAAYGVAGAVAYGHALQGYKNEKDEQTNNNRIRRKD